MAETRDDSPQDLAAAALQLTVAKGLGAGCQFIEATGNPVIVASAYRAFAQALYRENKDVQHMIDAGRRGIRFALDHAARIESGDPATAAKLREVAKTISFNVGAPIPGPAGVTTGSKFRLISARQVSKRQCSRSAS